jgi:uncharacterized MnhB-related membrane protein
MDFILGIIIFMFLLGSSMLIFKKQIINYIVNSQIQKVN